MPGLYSDGNRAATAARDMRLAENCDRSIVFSAPEPESGSGEITPRVMGTIAIEAAERSRFVIKPGFSNDIIMA